MSLYAKVITGFLLFLIYSMIPLIASAAASAAMTIKPAYNASCADLTGTWQGSFIDPTELFGNGGPWPIKFNLYNRGDTVIGQVDASQAPAYVKHSASGQFFAQCQQATLSKIFLKNKNHCGHFATQGALAGKNMLIFYLPYENAMNATDFLVVLTRSNNSYTGKIPKNVVSMQIPNIQTCH